MRPVPEVENVSLFLYVSPKQKAQFEKLAKAKGMKLSALGREMIDHYVKTAKPKAS